MDGTRGGWRRGNLTYSTPNPHIFIMEATPVIGKQEAYRGYVAIDNTQLTEGIWIVVVKFSINQSYILTHTVLQ